MYLCHLALLFSDISISDRDQLCVFLRFHNGWTWECPYDPDPWPLLISLVYVIELRVYCHLLFTVLWVHVYRLEIIGCKIVSFYNIVSLKDTMPVSHPFAYRMRMRTSFSFREIQFCFVVCFINFQCVGLIVVCYLILTSSLMKHPWMSSVDRHQHETCEYI
jgi:hypothetical protein